MNFDTLRFLNHLLVPAYKPKRPPTKLVAIMTPLSNKVELTADEQTSMRHLQHFLARYDKYLVAPRGLRVQFDGFQVKRFPAKFFGSSAAHNRLLYAPMFYEAFADYKFLFFYHLDSLVFSDQLRDWCETDLDYIGAPWLQCTDTPWVKKSRVGNGGFTLLRIEAALKALYNRYRQEPSAYWLDLLTRNTKPVKSILEVLKRVLPNVPRTKVVNRVAGELKMMERPGLYGRHNDFFWSFDAVRYLPEFKVAAVEEGLRFAFEAAPRTCFEMNGRQMPFGCHAWTQFDRSFWEPYLLNSDQLERPL